jgi:predicted PurR-regulated permease PerM
MSATSDQDQDGPSSAADSGHHRYVARPHSDDEGPIADAEATAAQARTEQQPLGPLGRRFDRRSPFVIATGAAAGVAVVIGLVQLLITVSSTLLMIGVALFLALGLEPVVSWLVQHGLKRAWAVTVVCLGVFLTVGAFLAIALAPLVEQVAAFVQQAPQYLQALQDQNTTLGGLNARFGIQQQVEQYSSTLLSGALGAGSTVLSALSTALIVLVLVVYFLATLPGLRTVLYRFAPHRRRPRTVLIGDAISERFGGYVLGNVVISLIAGTATFLWLLAIGAPYPLALALLVALLDLVPVVGAPLGGLIATLLALTVSPLAAVATAGFFIAYQLVEDYLLTPKIMGETVDVPAVLTVVAVLLGTAVLGVVGALIAIPIAAAVQLLVQEIAYPRLDRD